MINNIHLGRQIFSNLSKFMKHMNDSGSGQCADQAALDL